MCGIVGAVARGDARLAADELEASLRAIAHRGPDERGSWMGGECTLGHTRLAIIDLTEAAAQPMRSDDGGVVLVFNGEIYNHHDLRRELETRGHTFRSRSDTESILRGYQVWGDGVIERLDGMFALALWDAARGRLLLARDRAGKKPLFYGEANGMFRFGSTVAALHAAGHPRGIDESALPFYLAYGFVPPPATFHRDVAQLPPASRLVLERGRAPRVDTYWQPPFGESAGPVPTFAEASAHVRDLTVAAVARRLESDVPLGAFLSGGIDSTIVVGVMARLLGQRVRTFSIGFTGDPRFDETEFARLAARSFGTDHTEFKLEPSSFDLVETLVDHHDGPFGDSSAIPTYVVSKLARQHVTVALTGDGGDELFCGYERFIAAELSERVPSPLRRVASNLIHLLPAAESERSKLGKARRVLSAAALPLPDRVARWSSFFFDPRQLLRRDLSDALERAIDAPLAWQRAIFDRSRGHTVLARVLDHNFRTYLPFDLLVKADRTSMAHGLETRSPFLDTALIEYVARLPAGHLRSTVTKRVLKHAFRDLLPAAIRRRGKMGFGVPLGAWFRGDLNERLHDYLGESARLRRWLDGAALAKLLQEHDDRVADHAQKLWLLLTLEVWLRKCEQPAVAKPLAFACGATA
jgi:asparagine synthase (glutamine-hydrolysing)